MARKDERDAMNMNTSNVFSPLKSVHHMSERVYDVDYTATGDAPIETHEDIRLSDLLEEKDLNILNEEDE